MTTDTGMTNPSTSNQQTQSDLLARDFASLVRELQRVSERVNAAVSYNGRDFSTIQEASPREEAGDLKSDTSPLNVSSSPSGAAFYVSSCKKILQWIVSHCCCCVQSRGVLNHITLRFRDPSLEAQFHAEAQGHVRPIQQKRTERINEISHVDGFGEISGHSQGNTHDATSISMTSPDRSTNKSTLRYPRRPDLAHYIEILQDEGAFACGVSIQRILYWLVFFALISVVQTLAPTVLNIGSTGGSSDSRSAVREAAVVAYLLGVLFMAGYGIAVHVAMHPEQRVIAQRVFCWICRRQKDSNELHNIGIQTDKKQYDTLGSIARTLKQCLYSRKRPFMETPSNTDVPDVHPIPSAVAPIIIVILAVAPLLSEIYKGVIGGLGVYILTLNYYGAFQFLPARYWELVIGSFLGTLVYFIPALLCLNTEVVPRPQLILWIGLSVLYFVLFATVKYQRERVHREVFFRNTSTEMLEKDVKAIRDMKARMVSLQLPAFALERQRMGHNAFQEVTSIIFLTVHVENVENDKKIKTKVRDQIQLLNQAFAVLDSFSGIYGIDKVKTVGPSWVGAYGLSLSRVDDEETEGRYGAVAILEFVSAISLSIQRLSTSYYTIRVSAGISTDTCVVGLLGEGLAQYEVVGDPVIEAYMLSTMQPSGILVASSTLRKLPPDSEMRFSLGEKCTLYSSESHYGFISDYYRQLQGNVPPKIRTELGTGKARSKLSTARGTLDDTCLHETYLRRKSTSNMLLPRDAHTAPTTPTYRRRPLSLERRHDNNKIRNVRASLSDSNLVALVGNEQRTNKNKNGSNFTAKQIDTGDYFDKQVIKKQPLESQQSVHHQNTKSPLTVEIPPHDHAVTQDFPVSNQSHHRDSINARWTLGTEQKQHDKQEMHDVTRDSSNHKSRNVLGPSITPKDLNAMLRATSLKAKKIVATGKVQERDMLASSGRRGAYASYGNDMEIGQPDLYSMHDYTDPSDPAVSGVATWTSPTLSSNRPTYLNDTSDNGLVPDSSWKAAFMRCCRRRQKSEMSRTSCSTTPSAFTKFSNVLTGQIPQRRRRKPCSASRLCCFCISDFLEIREAHPELAIKATHYTLTHPFMFVLYMVACVVVMQAYHVRTYEDAWLEHVSAANWFTDTWDLYAIFVIILALIRLIIHAIAYPQRVVGIRLQNWMRLSVVQFGPSAQQGIAFPSAQEKQDSNNRTSHNMNQVYPHDLSESDPSKSDSLIHTEGQRETSRLDAQRMDTIGSSSTVSSMCDSMENGTANSDIQMPDALRDCTWSSSGFRITGLSAPGSIGLEQKTSQTIRNKKAGLGSGRVAKCFNQLTSFCQRFIKSYDNTAVYLMWVAIVAISVGAEWTVESQPEIVCGRAFHSTFWMTVAAAGYICMLMPLSMWVSYAYAMLLMMGWYVTVFSAYYYYQTQGYAWKLNGLPKGCNPPTHPGWTLVPCVGFALYFIVERYHQERLLLRMLLTGQRLAHATSQTLQQSASLNQSLRAVFPPHVLRLALAPNRRSLSHNRDVDRTGQHTARSTPGATTTAVSNSSHGLRLWPSRTSQKVEASPRLRRRSSNQASITPVNDSMKSNDTQTTPRNFATDLGEIKPSTHSTITTSIQKNIDLPSADTSSDLSMNSYDEDPLENFDLLIEKVPGASILVVNVLSLKQLSGLLSHSDLFLVLETLTTVLDSSMRAHGGRRARIMGGAFMYVFGLPDTYAAPLEPNELSHSSKSAHPGENADHNASGSEIDRASSKVNPTMDPKEAPRVPYSPAHASSKSEITNSSWRAIWGFDRAMQAVEELNTQFAVRIAISGVIHRGSVLSGILGSTHLTYDVYGFTCAVAEKMSLHIHEPSLLAMSQDAVASLFQELPASAAALCLTFGRIQPIGRGDKNDAELHRTHAVQSPHAQRLQQRSEGLAWHLNWTENLGQLLFKSQIQMTTLAFQERSSLDAARRTAAHYGTHQYLIPPDANQRQLKGAPYIMPPVPTSVLESYVPLVQELCHLISDSRVVVCLHSSSLSTNGDAQATSNTLEYSSRGINVGTTTSKQFNTATATRPINVGTNTRGSHTGANQTSGILGSSPDRLTLCIQHAWSKVNCSGIGHDRCDAESIYSLNTLMLDSFVYDRRTLMEADGMLTNHVKKNSSLELRNLFKRISGGGVPIKQDVVVSIDDVPAQTAQIICPHDYRSMRHDVEFSESKSDVMNSSITSQSCADTLPALAVPTATSQSPRFMPTDHMCPCSILIFKPWQDSSLIISALIPNQQDTQPVLRHSMERAPSLATESLNDAATLSADSGILAGGRADGHVKDNITTLRRDSPKDQLSELPKFDTSRTLTQPNSNARSFESMSVSHAKFTPSSSTSQKTIVSSTDKVNSPLNISDFKLVKRLGSGNFATTYLAIHRESRNLFAVKILDANTVRSRSLQAELKALTARSSHPCVVEFLTCLLSPLTRDVWLVMEYVEGHPLRTLLRDGRRVSVKSARHIIAETALGIGYLHSLGILHRDIKLDNIMLTFQRHVRIIDFGLSIVLDKSALKDLIRKQRKYSTVTLKSRHTANEEGALNSRRTNIKQNDAPSERSQTRLSSSSNTDVHTSTSSSTRQIRTDSSDIQPPEQGDTKRHRAVPAIRTHTQSGGVSYSMMSSRSSDTPASADDDSGHFPMSPSKQDGSRSGNTSSSVQRDESSTSNADSLKKAPSSATEYLFGETKQSSRPGKRLAKIPLDQHNSSDTVFRSSHHNGNLVNLLQSVLPAPNNRVLQALHTFKPADSTSNRDRVDGWLKPQVLIINTAAMPAWQAVSNAGNIPTMKAASRLLKSSESISVEGMLQRERSPSTSVSPEAVDPKMTATKLRQAGANVRMIWDIEEAKIDLSRNGRCVDLVVIQTCLHIGGAIQIAEHCAQLQLRTPLVALFSELSMTGHSFDWCVDRVRQSGIRLAFKLPLQSEAESRILELLSTESGSRLSAHGDGKFSGDVARSSTHTRSFSLPSSHDTPESHVNDQNVSGMGQHRENRMQARAVALRQSRRALSAADAPAKLKAKDVLAATDSASIGTVKPSKLQFPSTTEISSDVDRTISERGDEVADLYDHPSVAPGTSTCEKRQDSSIMTRSSSAQSNEASNSSVSLVPSVSHPVNPVPATAVTLPATTLAANFAGTPVVGSASINVTTSTQSQTPVREGSSGLPQQSHVTSDTHGSSSSNSEIAQRASLSKFAGTVHKRRNEPTVSSLAGTPLYIAPECYSKRTGLAADWFALGVVSFRILSGEYPFEGETRSEVTMNVTHNNVQWQKLPQSLPAEAVSLLRGLLHPDPVERIGGSAGVWELMQHKFFEGIDWDTLPDSKPPLLEVYAPRRPTTRAIHPLAQHHHRRTSPRNKPFALNPQPPGFAHLNSGVGVRRDMNTLQATPLSTPAHSTELRERQHKQKRKSNMSSDSSSYEDVEQTKSRQPALVRYSESPPLNSTRTETSNTKSESSKQTKQRTRVRSPEAEPTPGPMRDDSSSSTESSYGNKSSSSASAANRENNTQANDDADARTMRRLELLNRHRARLARTLSPEALLQWSAAAAGNALGTAPTTPEVQVSATNKQHTYKTPIRGSAGVRASWDNDLSSARNTRNIQRDTTVRRVPVGQIHRYRRGPTHHIMHSGSISMTLESINELSEASD